MNKIYFVYIPKPYLNNPTAQYGLGLLALATYAKKLGASIDIIDAQDQNYNWEPTEIPYNSTVLISACYVDSNFVNILSKKLYDKNCYIVIGGPICDMFESINFDVVSCAVKGPGEKFIEKLIYNKKPMGPIIEKNEIDFSQYPVPDRTLLKGNYGGSIFFHKTGINSNKSTTILTSRGCPFNCSFCKSGRIDYVYLYDLKRISEELDSIHNLGINNIRINDENIMINKKRLFEVCKLLDKRDIIWRASIRAKPSSIDMYNFMADHGCVEISVGIESGDDDVLRILEKGNTVKDNINCVENYLCSRIKNIRSLMMMCTPGETDKTLFLNMEWAKRFPDILICLCVFYPFPGTKVYLNPEKYNCIIEELDNANIYSYRSDGTEPESHISIIDGLSKKELTSNYVKMREFLEDRGQINHG